MCEGGEETAEKEAIPVNNKERASHKTFYMDDEKIAEAIVYREGFEERPAFLVYSLKLGGFTIEDYLIIGQERVKPTPPSKYPYSPYVFDFNDERKAPDPKMLFEEVLEEFRRFVDVEDEIRVLMASTVMLSYVQEFFETVPYLHLLGDNESGKTHTLQLFAALCYRPLYGVSIPSADLYTFLGSDGHIPTIIEDEIQGVERDSEKAKIWKVGYKRGAKVPRIMIKPNGEREIEYYPAYCLKISAGEKLIQLKGLAERFITVNMVEGDPESDEYTREDYERFQKLRRKLLLWRMELLIDSTWPPSLEIPWLKKRMKELYKPLLVVASVHPAYYQVLEKFVEAKVEEKNEIKRNSLEGFLTKIVASLIKEKKSNEIPFLDIWSRIKFELDVEESPSRPDRLETDAYGVLTKQKVGRRLREALGSRVQRRWEEGRATVIHIFDLRRLEKCIKRYRLTDLIDLTDFLRDIVEEEAAENGVKGLEKPILEAEEAPICSRKMVRTVRTVRHLNLSEARQDG